MTAAIVGPAVATVLLRVGTILPHTDFAIRLVDEVRYCGAGLDFVGVHWNGRVARSVGHSDVIAHGPFVVAKMLSIVPALAVVVSFRTRFVSPTYTPDDDRGALFRVSGEVVEEQCDGLVVVTLTATSATGPVLARVRAVVRNS